jgi:hypothetical protein
VSFLLQQSFLHRAILFSLIVSGKTTRTVPAARVFLRVTDARHPFKITALSSSARHRIKPLEFDTRISRPELPVDGANALVALLLPLLDLSTEVIDGGKVVSQLACLGV